MSSLASRLRHRITIYRPPDPEVDVDEAGQPLDEWVRVTETWAEIKPLSGRELFAAQQANAEVTARITLRYRIDIDRTMKVVFGKEEFEILYTIHKDYSKKELQLMCKERQ